MPLYEHVVISRQDLSNAQAEGLIEHFDATPSELIMFGRALASDEDWTCGFEDELVPLFLEIREKMKKAVESLECE